MMIRFLIGSMVAFVLMGSVVVVSNLTHRVRELEARQIELEVRAARFHNFEQQFEWRVLDLCRR
jgi:hypothetical protein